MRKDLQGWPGGLKAGVGQADITPAGDIHLSGDVGKFRPAQFVMDPLYARALVIESGGRKLCIVSLDLTIITEEYTAQIRQEAEKLGFDAAAVLVHVTQTHSAPSLGHFMVDPDFRHIPADQEWMRGCDPRYPPHALPRILDAIRQANASLQPVRIGVGSGIEGRMAFNRRAVMNDGRVRMPGRNWPDPLGPTYIRYLEGPIDPEVGVMALQTPGLGMLGMVLHYTCHPVHVFPKLIVSADWPGVWADEMQAAFGKTCIPLVLNGCCGNINPWDPFNPDYKNDHKLMGRALAAVAGRVIESLRWEDEPALDWRLRRVSIPIREVEPDLLEESRRMLEQHPQPLCSEKDPSRVDWAWMKAASVWSVHLMRQRSPALDYEIQVFRVGRSAIVGLPGEPFVEGQIRIKMASPALLTLVAHCTSQYVGYIPVREAIARGGHECETKYWAKLGPDALDLVVDAAGRLLQEVFVR